MRLGCLIPPDSPLRRLCAWGLLAALSAAGADVSGKWQGTVPGRDGNQREVRFQFEAKGDRLTGNMLGPAGESIAIAEGKLHAQGLSFKVTLQFNGTPLSLFYTGKFEGEELRLKMQREGAPRAIELLLKKAGS
jgi:hypothetical protein